MFALKKPSALWKPEYSDVILATDPIAYWVLDEKVGPVAYEWARRSQGSNQNGAITGTTLGQPGMGDGRTSQFFDGLTDFVDVWTAAFVAAFNGGEGTVAIWARVNGVGVWTDGAQHYIVYLRADANNFVRIWKSVVNNQLNWGFRAGGVDLTQTTVGHNDTAWMHLAITWSAAMNRVVAYKNGVQEGLIMPGVGVWAGPLILAIIGAASNAPVLPWHGWEDHGAIWTRALPPAEINYLYNKGYECQGRS